MQILKGAERNEEKVEMKKKREIKVTVFSGSVLAHYNTLALFGPPKIYKRFSNL